MKEIEAWKKKKFATLMNMEGNWIEALIYEYNPSTKKPYSVVKCKVKEVTKRGIKVTDDTKEEWLIEKEDIVSFKVLEG